MVNPSRNTLADCVRRGDGGDDACLVWRRFADHMMTLERGCLGWQPSTALEAWWRAGLVWCLFRSGELVGYVAARTGRTVCRVWQIAVRRDARRIEHGLMLLAAVEGAARAEGAHEISLWCAADIEAVAFWECVGFSMRQRRFKNRCRAREQYRYARTITRGLVQPWRVERLRLFGGVPPTARSPRRVVGVADPEFVLTGR
jgi:ribosomal protein S18 acetylase RimI-like enzyme